MHKAMRLSLLLGLAVALAAPTPSQAQDNRSDTGDKAVFVMTNDADRNAVIVFRRESDGSLTRAGRFFTGGRGSGGTTDPLGSQGSLS